MQQPTRRRVITTRRSPLRRKESEPHTELLSPRNQHWEMGPHYIWLLKKTVGLTSGRGGGLWETKTPLLKGLAWKLTYSKSQQRHSSLESTRVIWEENSDFNFRACARGKRSDGTVSRDGSIQGTIFFIKLSFHLAGTELVATIFVTLYQPC